MIIKAATTAIIVIVDKMRRTFISFFFPKKCVGCDCTGYWLCPCCMASLEYTRSQNCVVCGKAAIGG